MEEDQDITFCSWSSVFYLKVTLINEQMFTFEYTYSMIKIIHMKKFPEKGRRPVLSHRRV